MREKGEKVFKLGEGRKEGGSILIQTESVNKRMYSTDLKFSTHCISRTGSFSATFAQPNVKRKVTKIPISLICEGYRRLKFQNAERYGRFKENRYSSTER